MVPQRTRCRVMPLHMVPPSPPPRPPAPTQVLGALDPPPTMTTVRGSALPSIMGSWSRHDRFFMYAHVFAFALDLEP